MSYQWKGFYNTAHPVHFLISQFWKNRKQNPQKVFFFKIGAGRKWNLEPETRPEAEPDPGNGTGAEPRRKPPLDLRPGSDAHRPGDNLFYQNKLECLSLVWFLWDTLMVNSQI